MRGPIVVVSDDRVTGEALAVACRQAGLHVTVSDADEGVLHAEVVVVDRTASGRSWPAAAAGAAGHIVAVGADGGRPADVRVAAWVDTDASVRQLLDAIEGSPAATTPASGPGQRRPDRDQPAPLGDLTPREQEVLVALSAGAGTVDISTRLGISDHTVRTHLNNLLSKLGVSSRAEAVALAMRCGLDRSTTSGAGA